MLILRSAVFGICIATVSIAGNGLDAQQTYDVPKHFEMFDRYCRAALAGIEPFKATVRVPGPTGEQVFGVSPDGHHIVAKTGIDGFLVSASFQYGPGVVVRFCQVENLVVTGTRRDITEPAFLGAVPQGPGITITGGQVVEELPAIGSFALAGQGNIRTLRSQYNIFGATEPPGSFMTAYIGDNIFLLNATAMVGR